MISQLLCRFAAVAALSLGSLVSAQPLTTAFTFQGELRSGTSAADGAYDLKFSLFDAAVAGNQLGSQLCSDNISVAGGRVAVQLDFGLQFSGQQRFLEVWVRPHTGLDCSNNTGFSILGPRQSLTAAPNAVYATSAATAGNASNAAQLNGQPASFYTSAANLTGPLPSGALAGGAYAGPATLSTSTGTEPAMLGVSTSAVAGAAGLTGRYSGSAAGYGVRGESVSQIGAGVLGSASATSNFCVGVRGESHSPDGVGVFGAGLATSGNAYGGYFGSSSPAGAGLIGVNLNSTGSAYGVRGTSDSATGTGVYGLASRDSGQLNVGVYGQSESTAGVGVFGYTSAGNGASGAGVHGRSAGSTATAVWGYATNPTGPNYGGFFQTASTSGIGLYGLATATTGVTTAVLGECRSSNASAFAVYATGRLTATGTKSFRIDHPADPTNKVLLHYCCEAPEPQNFYNGIVTLDERGEALIMLPSYFAAINKSPRYTLTAIGAPMPAIHVALKISDSDLAKGAAAEPGTGIPLASFRISGGAPGEEVSWEVKAIRNDRWVQQRGAPVELDKPESEKGTYQHPELYGQPREKAATYRPPPAPAFDANSPVPTNE